MTDTDRLDSIERKLDALTLILTGNGHPEEGLAFRVATVERTHAACRAEQVEARKTTRWRADWFVSVLALGVAVIALWVR